MEPILNVVLPVFAIILTGYLAGRVGVMGASSTDALNRFVYYVALPVLLGHSMARVDASTIFDAPFILAYLGGNAVKFTETGGVIVQASYHDGELSLIFKDTGPGISKTDQSTLFKHFERGAAEHNATPGAGLGLAMVKRLAEAMEGEVGVSSEPGQGATFWTRFPARALAPPPEGRASGPAARGSPFPPRPRAAGRGDPGDR